MRTAIFIACLVCLYPAVPAAESPPSPFDFKQPWEIIETREKATLYRHPWPKGGISTFKVDMEMDASADELLSIITDVRSYQRWVPYCRKVEILKKTGTGSFIYYFAMDLPWPASNREWVNKLTVSRNAADNSIRVSFMAVDYFYPKSNRYIRVKKHIAHWILIPISPGRTRSIWQWCTDPGGHLPDWRIEWASRDQVMESIKKIREILSK